MNRTLDQPARIQARPAREDTSGPPSILRRPLIIGITAVLTLGLSASPSWTADEKERDERESFEVSFYLGDSISSFAASEVKALENPEGSNRIQHGFVAGVDFETKLTGSRKHALWLYGETVHGVQSTEVNCEEKPDTEICRNQGHSGDDVLFVIRNATSLEAYLGFRWEFAKLHPKIGNTKGSEGRVYVIGDGGFITVAGSGGDFVDNHFFGVGARIVEGKFIGSYVDMGWGRTDLYLINRSQRLKFDGYLTWNFKPLEHTRGFFQFYVDTDAGAGSDTALIFLGLEFDVDQVFKE